MATLVDQLERRWEIHHPLILSAATFAIALWQGPAAYAYADANKWHVDQLYVCVFTFATVLTAFLFTFYTFIITGDRGFLSASRNTTYFRQTIGYTFRAIITGTILSLATVPMLVVQPTPKVGDAWMIAAAAWAALTVWSAASFVRAAWLFAIFASK